MIEPTEPAPPTPEPQPVRIDAEKRGRLADRFPAVLEAYRAAGVFLPDLAAPHRAA